MKLCKIKLDSDDDYLLPAMHSDIMLSDKSEENVLIIDAKYYESATQMHFGKRTLISENLYQIFTYVKNKEKELEGKKHTVSGMLLYAKTDEKLLPDNEYIMSGNKIAVKTLDLNCSFDEIKKQLDAIAEPLINS